MILELLVGNLTSNIQQVSHLKIFSLILSIGLGLKSESDYEYFKKEAKDMVNILKKMLLEGKCVMSNCYTVECKIIIGFKRYNNNVLLRGFTI